MRQIRTVAHRANATPLAPFPLPAATPLLDSARASRESAERVATSASPATLDFRSPVASRARALRRVPSRRSATRLRELANATPTLTGSRAAHVPADSTTFPPAHRVYVTQPVP